MKKRFLFFLKGLYFVIPHKDGVDLIENNLVTRVSAQKNFTVKSETKISILLRWITVYLKSLIMAQIERWRQASYMQVERESIFGCE